MASPPDDYDYYDEEEDTYYKYKYISYFGDVEPYFEYNGTDDDDYIRNIGAPSVTINAGDGDDTIYNTTGGSVTLIYRGKNDYEEEESYYEENPSDCLINGEAGNDYIYNEGRYATIDGGAGDDTISNSGKNLLVTYTEGDGNDVINGFNSTSRLRIGDGTGTYSKETVDSDVIITVGDGKITLQGAASLSAVNIDGEEQRSDTLKLTDSDAAKQTLAAQIVTADATARTKATRIVGNALDNSILGGAGKDTLYGKDGDDFLSGGKGNDKLYGQNGDDTLHGGAGNDTLSGGSGNDLFIYSAGNDIITDYATGDKISLGANVSSATVDGSDAILTVGKNTLTITNGKGKQLTLIDANGNEYTTTVGGLVLDNTAGATTLAAGIAEADASARTKAIKITGNALDNTILGGGGKDILYGKDGNDYIAGGANADKLYGQNGDDTLWGGLGNDTLAGGAGADVFIYTAGDDVISDFDSDDLLQITGEFSASYSLTDNSIVFATSNGSVKLKNFTTTTFNVNGDTYVLGLSKK